MVVVRVATPHIHYEGIVIRVMGSLVTVKVTKILHDHSPEPVVLNQQRDVHFAHIVDPTATPKKKKKK